ncbi:Protein of unknown function [Cotesia congregata]|uniref:Uncharacterized protein n=1 Tax=Cotesia congregata TaxID=51543 RepID=A0A8J2MK41_COTCN|nr:Protein of unknown function [Cotesia congregata]
MAQGIFIIQTVLLIVAIFNASGADLGWNDRGTNLTYVGDKEIANTVLTSIQDGILHHFIVTKYKNKNNNKMILEKEVYTVHNPEGDHVQNITKYYDSTGTKVVSEDREITFFRDTTKIIDISTTTTEADGSKTEVYAKYEFPKGLPLVNKTGTYEYKYGPDNKLIKTIHNAIKTQGRLNEKTYEVTIVNDDGSKTQIGNVTILEGDKTITDVKVSNLDSKDEELISFWTYTIDNKSDNTKAVQTTNTTKNSDGSITTDLKIWRTYANGTRTREQVTTTKLNGELTSADYYPLEIEVEGVNPETKTPDSKITVVPPGYRPKDHERNTTKYYDSTGTRVAYEISESSFFYGTTKVTELSKTVMELDGSKTEIYAITEFPPELPPIRIIGTYKYAPSNKLTKSIRNIKTLNNGSEEDTDEVIVLNSNGSKTKRTTIRSSKDGFIIKDVTVVELDIEDKEISSNRTYVKYNRNDNTKVVEPTN